MTSDTTMDDLLDRLTGMARSERRALVALAGPPGAGKSHVADALAAGLEARAPGRAAVLPMDGYHFDDMLLEARGHRARKGAPHTFDIDGLRVMLERLAADDGRPVVVPVFDRGIEIARAGAREIPASVRLVIVEGNYLLLDRPGWRELGGCFGLTVFIDVAEPVLRQRLAARWAGLDPEEAAARLEGNDLPNMRLVLEQGRPADLRLPNG
ncbi:nucleoside/nucleotide kinase family protein [Paracoccus alkanivorans]|uniref:Nucleoside/nucleotide kinase family protein n=1 Tax=Paracoccus alkanivorans TaxID=2116655 RepID=A0A3M0M058_9RHOB|nr:nucleoside/nucleotide kinase family protein [Paracoccus alkanivorans]